MLLHYLSVRNYHKELPFGKVFEGSMSSVPVGLSRLQISRRERTSEQQEESYTTYDDCQCQDSSWSGTKVSGADLADVEDLVDFTKEGDILQTCLGGHPTELSVDLVTPSLPSEGASHAIVGGISRFQIPRREGKSGKIAGGLSRL